MLAGLGRLNDQVAVIPHPFHQGLEQRFVDFAPLIVDAHPLARVPPFYDHLVGSVGQVGEDLVHGPGRIDLHRRILFPDLREHSKAFFPGHRDVLPALLRR